MKKNKLSIRKKSLLSNFLNKILRQLKLFILFFIPKKYKEFVEESELGQPYSIIIDNIGDEILENIDFFGSYENISKPFYDLEGNMEFGSIKIRPNKVSIVSYREMLYQFMNHPFTVGLTIIKSTTPYQILSVIKVQTKDANGNSAQKTLVPTITPYPSKIMDCQINMNYTYGIDGFTKLVLEEIYPKTRVEIYLYPKLNNSESKKTRFKKFLAWLKK
jgi:hypothetical protein